MNKDEIKKALECCSNPSINYCNGCPYANNGEFSCRDGVMFKDTLALITEQDKEIEYRKKQYDNQIAENTQLHIEYNKAFERLTAQQREIDRLKIQLEQANTGIVNCSGCELVYTNGIKEFAEKLKDLLYTAYGKHGAPLGDLTAEDIACEIDELLKEYERCGAGEKE